MTNYHRSAGGQWKRCIAQTPAGCHYGGAVVHGSGYAGIAGEGGGLVRTNGKLVEIIPEGEGYLTLSENGQVGVYGADGKAIPLAQRRREGWKKEQALAEANDSEKTKRLKDEIRNALVADSFATAKRQAMKTQAWRHLSEEITAKGQEYADAHYGEAYAFGSDEELDNLHSQRWALIAEKAPAGYSRRLAEAEGATPEELEEIDRENEKAQAIADEIRAEQDALSATGDSKQLTTSQRRLRGWDSPKGSRATANLAKAQAAANLVRSVEGTAGNFFSELKETSGLTIEALDISPEGMKAADAARQQRALTAPPQDYDDLDEAMGQYAKEVLSSAWHSDPDDADLFDDFDD